MANKDVLEGFLSDIDMDKQPKEKPETKNYKIKIEDENDDILKGMQTRSMQSLKETQKEIFELVEERKALTKEVSESVDKIASKINTMTISVSDSNPEALAEKLNLMKKWAELEEMKVKEKVDCWRDIALLKRELREWNREVREKESETSMLDNILE